jgi:Flp pilus assembly protein TadD
LVLGTSLAVLLGSLSWRRNLDYRTALAIWSDTLEKRPGNTRARSLLAAALDDAGDPEAALRELTYCIEQGRVSEPRTGLLPAATV